MGQGRMLVSLQLIPMPLLALFIFSLIWRWIPKCFWDDICWTVELLNKRGGRYNCLSSVKKLPLEHV